MMVWRLSVRFGHRGVWLMLLGSIYVVFGLGILIEPPLQQSWVLYQYLPDWLEAGAWWVTGLVAFWQGWRGIDRDDWLGHVALYLGPASRVVSFTIAWLIHLGSGALVSLGCINHTTGYDRGWYAGLIWLIVSAMLALAASWPNPTAPLPQPPVAARAES